MEARRYHGAVQASTPFQNGRPALSREERGDACDGTGDVRPSVGEGHMVGVDVVGRVRGGQDLG